MSNKRVSKTTSPRKKKKPTQQAIPIKKTKFKKLPDISTIPGDYWVNASFPRLYPSVAGWDKNASSLLHRFFNFEELPEDYIRACKRVMDVLELRRIYKDLYGFGRNESVISKEEKEHLSKFFDLEEPLENKQAVVFIPIGFLMHHKFNRYRPGGTKFYMEKFSKMKSSHKKLQLPFFEVKPDGSKIDVAEGNHRIRALYNLGFRFAPVKLHCWY